MIGLYSFAGVKVQIESLYERVHRFCADYAVSGDADLNVVIHPQDIDRERYFFERVQRRENLNDPCPQPESLELLAVYRLIATAITKWNVFLMHGSAIAVDGKAYVFTARSGTGKSTHSRLWREMLGERAVMVNDDKPLIRLAEDGTAMIYGTPWNGKHRLGENIAVPLKAICILERSADNRIQKITKNEAYPMLLQQTNRPEDPDALKRTMLMLDRIKVDFWRLGCNMDPGAAELSYRTMSGDAATDEPAAR